MATQSSNPFYGNQRNGSIPSDSSTRNLALDNLIRRELKVSDPNNPNEVAEALLTRYKETPRAMSISREAEGTPFLPMASTQAMPTQATTSSSAELQQAIDDVERDLLELTTNSILKDVKVELEGWASAVRSAIREGVDAARFALDTRQRDKAFGIRRTLGDYARMARLVGALTPTLNVTYRKFAQSMDEVASVLLVIMGEALANVGFSGGRFLLQVPYSELQTRRDAVINALRNLTGSTQQAYGPNDWPRGLDAYRRLFDELENQGQGDLRALLVENELARTMDTLIQRAAHGNVEGLRQLGSTAQLDLERFRRLVIIAQRLVRPESPPLTTFLAALQLFANAFNNAGGFRLMKIARPPILFYGLYGTTGLDESDQILLNLITNRGILADELDCLMSCSCDQSTVLCQIMLDKILYDLDRAIDLYVMSSTRFGLPERRACAYSFMISSFIAPDPNTDPGKEITQIKTSLPVGSRNKIADLQTSILSNLQAQIAPRDGLLGESVNDLIRAANEVVSLLMSLKKCADKQGFDHCKDISTKRDLLNNSRNFSNLVLLVRAINVAQAWMIQEKVAQIPSLPESVWHDLLDIVHQELCIQEDMEGRWENLVATMAPSCIRFSSTVFPVLKNLIQNAKDIIGSMPCEEFDIKIPPHFETSLDSLVFGNDSDGAGRI